MLLGLVAAVGLFHVLTLRPGDPSHGDVLQMLMHAENLGQGEPYASIGYIQNPQRFYSPVGYPPGYPLLLAPLVALFGASMDLVRAVAVGLITVGVGALAVLLRRHVAAVYLYLFVLAAGLQPYLWEAKHFGFSGFVVLGVASLSLALYEVEARSAREAALRPLGAGLLGGLAASAHPLAWALLPAFLAGDLVRHRRVTRRFLWTLAGVVLCYGALAVLIDTTAGARVAQGTSVGDGVSGGYEAILIGLLQDVTEVPRQVVARIYDYSRITYVFWYAPLPGAVVWKYGLLVVSLVPVGWGWGLRLRRHGTAEVFCAVYTAGLLPWSFADTRYVIPLIPLYYLYLVTGLDAMTEASPSRGRAATVATVVALVVVYASRYAFHEPPTPNPDQEAAYEYARVGTPPSAVFVTNADPRQIAYRSDRTASLGPRDFGQWTGYASAIGADYAMVRSSQDSTFRLPADAHPRVAFERGIWAVYRIRPPADTLTEAPARARRPSGGR